MYYYKNLDFLKNLLFSQFVLSCTYSGYYSKPDKFIKNFLLIWRKL